MRGENATSDVCRGPVFYASAVRTYIDTSPANRLPVITIRVGLAVPGTFVFSAGKSTIISRFQNKTGEINFLLGATPRGVEFE